MIPNEQPVLLSFVSFRGPPSTHLGLVRTALPLCQEWWAASSSHPTEMVLVVSCHPSAGWNVCSGSWYS